MAAPFQQTSRTVYQDYQAKISPTALLRPNGAAFEAAFGSVKDAQLDRDIAAVKAKYPNIAPSDALNIIGADRGMPRGQSEGDAAYAARLVNTWNTWPWAGTAYGLLQAFWATGYQNVALAQPNGGKVFFLDQGGTNRLTWSGDISNAAWTKTNCTAARNNAAAPDGTTTAGLLTATANAGFVAQQGIASAAAVQYTGSVWLKLSGGAHSAEVIIWDTTAGGALATSGLVALTGSFVRISASGLGVAGHALQLRIYPAGNQAATGAALAAYPQFEIATAPGPYVQTYATSYPTSAGAGVLVTTAEANAIWQNRILATVTAPLRQSFWSAFDVVFPLPLMPQSWGWSGGIPGSSSAEANFIRSLIAAWKPGHATCNSIVIVQQGSVWGYPASGTWGETGDLWGSDTTTVWTP
jgi:hypothetical protein